MCIVHRSTKSYSDSLQLTAPLYWKANFLQQPTAGLTQISSLQNYFTYRYWFLFMLLNYTVPRKHFWTLESMLLNCQHGPSDHFWPSQFVLSQTIPQMSSGAKTTGGNIFTGSLDMTTVLEGKGVSY